MSDDATTMGELSDDSDSDDSDTESLASSVAELSSGLLQALFKFCVYCRTGLIVNCELTLNSSKVILKA